MTERRLLLLQVLAQRTRLLDAVLAVALAIIASFALAALGLMAWSGAFLLVTFIGLAAYARYLWGERTLARRARALEVTDEAGLSLATAEAVIECLPDPLLLLDAEGRILFSNAATQALVGAAPLRRHVSAVLRAPGLLEAVNLVLKGAPAQTVEYSHMVPVERYIRAYVTPISLSNGHGDDGSGGAIVVLHELTAQKRAEQMRADFVANASHELRTPLSSLSGFIDTLRGHAKEDAEARERFLDIMHDQAGRMRRLIEDLLSLSRIELNEHIKPENRVSLPDVVKDVVDSLGPQAESRNVTLDMEIEPGVPEVLGARDELIQVVQNLVDNAVKYGVSGERVVIKVGDAGEGEARRVSFVAVQDFGEGIAREHLPRLTERFYRVDVKRSRQTGGTGLGLAIVKHIVNRHRGWLSIESTLGEGSTFTVFLPQVRGGVGELAEEVPMAEHVAQPAA